MEPESKVDVYKRLVVDMLCGAGGAWHTFSEIEDDFRVCDGEVDSDALGTAIDELLDEGKIEHEERNCKDEYRWVPPQEGENLVEKLRRLEAENAELRIQMAAFDLAKEQVDKAVERAAAVLRLREENSRLEAARDELESHAEWLRAALLDAEEIAGRIRAEQAADRAAVMALVDALPRCWSPGCGQPATTCYPPHDDESCDAHDVAGRCRAHDNWYAAPLRALQAQMATWPSDAGAGDNVQAGGPGLTFEEATRRYPEAWSGARVQIDEATYWKAEPSTTHEPSVHPSPESVERVAKAWAVAQSMVDAGLVGPSKVGGTYAEQLGAPKGCCCTWRVQPTFVGAPVVHRGRGMMPCPVHADAEDAPEWHRQPSRSPRYIGEFGDIDEPSVGDVDGYGRRK